MPLDTSRKELGLITWLRTLWYFGAICFTFFPQNSNLNVEQSWFVCLCIILASKFSAI